MEHMAFYFYFYQCNLLPSLFWCVILAVIDSTHYCHALACNLLRNMPPWTFWTRSIMEKLWSLWSVNYHLVLAYNAAGMRTRADIHCVFFGGDLMVLMKLCSGAIVAAHWKLRKQFLMWSHSWFSLTHSDFEVVVFLLGELEAEM